MSDDEDARRFSQRPNSALLLSARARAHVNIYPARVLGSEHQFTMRERERERSRLYGFLSDICESLAIPHRRFPERRPIRTRRGQRAEAVKRLLKRDVLGIDEAECSRAHSACTTFGNRSRLIVRDTFARLVGGKLQSRHREDARGRERLSIRDANLADP